MRNTQRQRTISEENSDDEQIKKKKITQLQLRTVHCGSNFSILLDKKGEAWSFGIGNEGQLGLNKRIRFQLKLSSISGSNPNLIFQDVSCGQNNVLAINSKSNKNNFDIYITTNKQIDSGSLYCWGSVSSNKCGILRREKADDQLEPLNISEEVTIKTKLAIKKRESRIILPSPVSRLQILETQQKIQSLNESLYEIPKISLVSCGAQHSYCGVSENKYILCFGFNQNGKIGIGQKEKELVEPQIMTFFNSISVVGISCSRDHCAAWDQQGFVYTWGDPQCNVLFLNKKFGKLGYPFHQGVRISEIQRIPKKVEALSEEFIIQVSCTYKETVALTRDGYLYSWGIGNAAERVFDTKNKLKTFSECFKPTLLDVKIDGQVVNFVKVSGRYSHLAAIDKFGRLFTWGDNTEECLGHPDLIQSYKQNEQIIYDLRQPRLVQEFINEFVVDADCGQNFTTIICANKKKFKIEESVHHKKYLLYRKQEIQNQVDLINQYSKRKVNFQNSLERKASHSIGNRSQHQTPRKSNRVETVHTQSQFSQSPNIIPFTNQSNQQLSQFMDSPSATYQILQSPQHKQLTKLKKMPSINVNVVQQQAQSNQQISISSQQSSTQQEQDNKIQRMIPSLQVQIPQREYGGSQVSLMQHTVMNLANQNQNQGFEKQQPSYSSPQRKNYTPIKNQFYLGSQNLKSSIKKDSFHSSNNFSNLTSRHKKLVELQSNKSANLIYNGKVNEYFNTSRLLKTDRVVNQEVKEEEVKTLENLVKNSTNQIQIVSYHQLVDSNSKSKLQTTTLLENDPKISIALLPSQRKLFQFFSSQKEQDASTARYTSSNINETAQKEFFTESKEMNTINSPTSSNKSFEFQIKNFQNQNQKYEYGFQNIDVVQESNSPDSKKDKILLHQQYQYLSQSRFSSFHSNISQQENDQEKQKLQEFLSNKKWKTIAEKNKLIKKFKEQQHLERVKKLIEQESMQQKKNLIANISSDILIKEYGEEQGFLASYNFDQVTDKIISKEIQDPNYFPLVKNDSIAALFQQIDKTSLEYPQIDQLQRKIIQISNQNEKERRFKNIIKNEDIKNTNQDSLVSQQLQEEIDSCQNDKQKLQLTLLKNEYLAMIQNNQEKEHFVYLLSEPGNKKKQQLQIDPSLPLSARNYNEQQDIGLRMDRKLSFTTRKIMKNNEQQEQLDEIVKMNDEFQKEIKEIPATPDFNESLKNIKQTLNRVNMQQKVNKDVREVLHQMSLQKVNIQTKQIKLQEIQKNSQKQKERITQAHLLNEQILKQKIERIKEQINKRRHSFITMQQMIVEQKKDKQKKLAQIMVYLTAEQVINFLGNAKYEVLEKKKNMFRKNLCASLIQRQYRFYILNKKTLQAMPEKVKQFFKRVIIRFIMWCQHQELSLVRILSNKWDHYLTSIYKIQDNELAQLLKQQFKFGQSTLEYSLFQQFLIVGKGQETINSIPSYNQTSALDFKLFKTKERDSVYKLLHMGIYEAKQISSHDLKIIPNILPIATELKNQTLIEIEEKQKDGDLFQKKSNLKGNKPKIHFTQQIVNSIATHQSEFLLPFTVHKDLLHLPPTFKITYGNENIHNQIFQKSIKLEFDLKLKYLKKHIRKLKKDFYLKMKNYKVQLQEFILQNKKIINLKRTELMIKAGQDQLNKIQKREEIQYSQRIQRIRMRRPKPRDKDLFMKDHLPFGSVITEIAATMPEAPKRPKLRFNLTHKQFEEYFRNSYEEFVLGYNQLSLNQRMKTHQISKKVE